MQKIVVVTGDGGESYEALYAVHRLREAGYEPVVAAPSRRRLHLVIHDFEPGWDTYVERPGYGLESDITFSEVKVSDYSAILLVGGRAPEYLRNNQTLVGLAREFDRSGKWIFAICHGVQVLAVAGLAAGKRMTCYEHVRSEIERAGATFCPNQSVRDGNMVTAQTWQSHPDFYREIMLCLAETRPEVLAATPLAAAVVALIEEPAIEPPEIATEAAVPIPLVFDRDFLHFGSVVDPRCVSRCSWVFSIRSSIGAAQLIREAPKRIKMCSAEFVKPLVVRALPGLSLTHMPAPPRAIAGSPDRLYFQVGQNGPCWNHIVATRRVGVYVPGEFFPDCEVALFAVMEG